MARSDQCRLPCRAGLRPQATIGMAMFSTALGRIAMSTHMKHPSALEHLRNAEETSPSAHLCAHRVLARSARGRIDPGGRPWAVRPDQPKRGRPFPRKHVKGST
ncbi:hypothetical protein [Xanthomonas bundabergensis]|uniref:hypothetical protein n=1 Tax=Xanthomonas bundabergensis TaxID=3160842 RepID=UPI003516A5A7